MRPFLQNTNTLKRKEGKMEGRGEKKKNKGYASASLSIFFSYPNFRGN